MRALVSIAALSCLISCAPSGGVGQIPVTFEVGSVEAWRSLKPGMSKDHVKRVLGEPVAVAVRAVTDTHGGLVNNKFWEQWEYPPGGFVVFMIETGFLKDSPRVMKWREPGEWVKDDSR